MFDIHYHLLYGLDDGPKTIEDSIALAEASIAEGVTHIVATPHSNYKYKFDPAVNRERADELQRLLNGRLTIGLGCDLHLSYENVQEVLASHSRYSINGGRYLLVELAETSIPAKLSEILFQMRVAGIIPIITHPERNPLLLSQAARLYEWICEGCLIQVTGASLAGRFGKRAERACQQWIEQGWVHFIASDAHSVEWRAPSMSDAHRAASRLFGQVTADRLCIHNPRAAFLNDDLPPQPQPVEPDLRRAVPKRRFFSRLFGR